MGMLEDQNIRKDRLAFLRANGTKRKRDAVNEDITTPALVEEHSVSHIRFRNYDPQNKAPKLGFLASPTQDESQTVESRASTLTAQINGASDVHHNLEARPTNLIMLQLESSDKDLKRDMNRKLDILKVKQSLVVSNIVRNRIMSTQSVTAVARPLMRSVAQLEAAEKLCTTEDEFL